MHIYIHIHIYIYMMVLAATPMMSDPAGLAALYPMNKWQGKKKQRQQSPQKDIRFHNILGLQYHLYCIHSTSPTFYPGRWFFISLFIPLAHAWVGIYQRLSILVFFTGFEIRNQPRIMFNRPIQGLRIRLVDDFFSQA